MTPYDNTPLARRQEQSIAYEVGMGELLHDPANAAVLLYARGWRALYTVRNVVAYLYHPPTEGQIAVSRDLFDAMDTIEPADPWTR